MYINSNNEFRIQKYLMTRSARFIIDKITNSIEKVESGESFETIITPVTAEEIKTVHKKDGWFFNWKKEFKIKDRQVYKLTLEGDNRIQGLLCIQPLPDEKYIEMHLIENAPHNLKETKEFVGVAGNLVAYACMMSFEKGYDGMVAFTAKTQLTDHYKQTLGAELIYGRERMAIFTPSSKKLVNSYYKEYFDESK